MFFKNKKEILKIEKEVKEILENADACLIFTGAGMGVDSGLDVFRGNEGLWSKFPDAGNLKLGFKDLANPNNYLKHPDVVIPFYLYRLKSYIENEPHSGYYELFGYAENLKEKYFVTTSNVDGFLHKTGFHHDHIHEEHGSIHKWQCSNYKCSHNQGVEGLVDISTLNTDNYESLKCSICGEYLRPNLCMFWDAEWLDSLYSAQEMKFNVYYNRLRERRRANVAVIEIGAGTAIRTIRSKSEMSAFDFDTKLIRINPDQEKSYVDETTIHINKSAAEGISYIMNLITEKEKQE